MTVTYEWDIETVDEHGDIIDHYHRSRLHDFGGERLTLAINEDDNTRLVLVRDADASRSWAYVEDGKLPTHFLDANEVAIAKVPKRFHQEFNL